MLQSDVEQIVPVILARASSERRRMDENPEGKCGIPNYRCLSKEPYRRRYLANYDCDRWEWTGDGSPRYLSRLYNILVVQTPNSASKTGDVKLRLENYLTEIVCIFCSWERPTLSRGIPVPLSELAWQRYRCLALCSKILQKELHGLDILHSYSDVSYYGLT